MSLFCTQASVWIFHIKTKTTHPTLHRSHQSLSARQKLLSSSNFKTLKETSWRIHNTCFWKIAAVLLPERSGSNSHEGEDVSTRVASHKDVPWWMELNDAADWRQDVTLKFMQQPTIHTKGFHLKMRREEINLYLCLMLASYSCNQPCLNMAVTQFWI